MICPLFLQLSVQSRLGQGEGLPQLHKLRQVPQTLDGNELQEPSRRDRLEYKDAEGLQRRQIQQN